MTVQEFVGELFKIETTTHIAHTQTTGVGSYAQHMALNTLYTEIVGLRDDFMEAYIGKYMIIKDIPIEKEPEGQDMAVYVKRKATLIEEYEKTLKDGFLQQIVQSIIQLLYSTNYKLRNLK